MNHDTLRTALSVVIQEDYADFLDDTTHVFSPRFEKRMNRLIRRERRPLWPYTNTLGKRLALTALVMVLFLAGLFSISASARDAVVHLLHVISSGHVDYLFPGTNSRTIDEYISFSSVPEGFEEIECEKTPSVVIYRLRNSAGDIIELQQLVGGSIGIDTAKHILKEYAVSGTAVDLYVCTIEQSMIAMWSIDRYIVTLQVWGDYSENQVLNWISFVKLQK